MILFPNQEGSREEDDPPDYSLLTREFSCGLLRDMGALPALQETKPPSSGGHPATNLVSVKKMTLDKNSEQNSMPAWTFAWTGSIVV